MAVSADMTRERLLALNTERCTCTSYARMNHSCAPMKHFIRTNASFMRTNAAFMSTSASLMRTNGSFVLVSQLTRPLSNTPFMHTNESLMRMNASFMLVSHLIDLEIHNYCQFCKPLLSSPESITAKNSGEKQTRQPSPTESQPPGRPACRPPRPSSQSSLCPSPKCHPEDYPAPRPGRHTYPAQLFLIRLHARVTEPH